MALGCLASVSAGAAPAVRVVSVHKHYLLTYRRTGFEVQDIFALSRTAAWAIARRVNTAGRIFASSLLHYDGRRWTPQSFPFHRTFSPDSITAFSRNDVWLFGLKAGSEFALHYVHGAWHVFPLPTDSGEASLVLGDNDIWVAAGPLAIPGCDGREFGPGCSAAAHWDGSAWHYLPVQVSNLTSLAGTSPADIWAAGYDNVRTQQTDRLQPYVFRLQKPKFERTRLRAARTDYVPLLTVDSSRDVFLGGTSPRRAPATCVSHWNGQRWSAFNIARAGSLGLCDNLLGDGHDGVWFSPEVHWTGSEFMDFAGPPTPAGIGLAQGVAPVPRTRIQWVYGYTQKILHGARHITAFIYKRG